jgi:hypothetical protein
MGRSRMGSSNRHFIVLLLYQPGLMGRLERAKRLELATFS